MEYLLLFVDDFTTPSGQKNQDLALRSLNKNER